MDKKILVLGIGFSQVDLIRIAKEMGMTVFACALDSEGPGKELVDGFRQIDLKDSEAVKRYAAETGADFIFTMGQEIAVWTMTNVSQELQLPTFCTVQSLSRICDKGCWRRILNTAEGNIPFCCGTQAKDFADWTIYPAILKPVDGAGQRGIAKVFDYQDIERSFQGVLDCSRTKKVMLEEYIDGPEISVNAFLLNGSMKFMAITDRISYGQYPGIIREHRIPSRATDAAMEKKVVSLLNEVNRIMGFQDGPVYYQIKLTGEGPKIIEFTPRFDGCHIWRLIELGTGLDLRRVALEVLSTGESPSLERFTVTKKDQGYILRFLSDKPGVIVDRDNYALPDDPVYLQWYYDNGEKIRPITGHLEKVGYVVMTG